MTKLLAGKISALVAAFTTSIILSGCETTEAGRPELCKVNPKASQCLKARVLHPKAKVVQPRKATAKLRQNRVDY